MNYQKQFTTFYIARHGKTEWNVEGRMQGHEDSALTEEGIEQANNLAGELKDIHFDLAFSSDLLRAKRTAEIITLEKKLAIQTTELLRERAFGHYEGKYYIDVEPYDLLVKKLKEEDRLSFKAHGVESIEETITRMLTFIRETAITHPSKTILVVSHGAIMRAFLIHIGCGTYKNLGYEAVGNAAYFKLETDGINFFVKETRRITFTDK